MSDPDPAGRSDGGGPAGPLFEHFPDPLVRYDANGGLTVSAVNPAFERTFETAAEEVEGSALAVVFRIMAGNQSERAAEPEAVLDGARRGEPVCVTIDVGTSPDPRQFLARTVPLPGANAGYLQLRDVTEYEQTIARLEARVERLEESTHVIAHDIRNPLEVAEINLEVARETGDEELLEEVAQAHDQIERLIKDVLTLAARGEVIGEQTRVDFEAVAAEAWSNVDTGNASLDIEESCVLEADADRFRQLLENLLRNAIEHGGDEVGVSAGRLDGHPGFYVEDDGPGIPAEARDRVFEQGYSVDDGGSGFGLAIVKRIADAHGWRVDVTTGRDGGARLEFTDVAVADANG